MLVLHLADVPTGATLGGFQLASVHPADTLKSP